MGKLCVALLLLLSTLSSQPLGSMEQSVPEPTAPLAHASALPLARALDGAAEVQVAPDRIPEPPILHLHAAPVVAASVDLPGGPAARAVAPFPPDAASSALDRLPYFATPPPSPTL